MSSTTTTKRIHLGRLSAELGGAQVWLNGDEMATTQRTVTSDATQAALNAAVAAHVAFDTEANAAILRQRAQAALAPNLTYLNRSSPTAAQNTAQVQALTRECSAVIRLLLGLLDDVTGT